MSMDLSEFLDVFFEECFEGLDAMESGLIALDSGNADAEEINTVFRAAHSIKGGAATFDMMPVADFTHVMEALLDEMRDGRRSVSKAAVDLLLVSVDRLRSMCTAIRANEDVDQSQVNTLKAKLEAMLAGDDMVGQLPDGNEPQTTSATTEKVEPMDVDDSRESSPCQPMGAHEHCWTILFAPKRGILATGNDPQHVLRALQELGSLEVAVDLGGLPTLADMEAESSYLAWTLRLSTGAEEASIREAFAWIEDECELELRRDPVNSDQSLATPSHESKEHSPVETASQASPPSLLPCASGTHVASPDIADESESNSAVAPARTLAAPRGPGAGVEPSGTNRSGQRASGGPEGGSIRVGIDKVDELINLVGELVITQSMLSRFAEGVGDSQLEQLREGLSALSRNTRELQETAMQIRMLPISTSFNRFPRLIRDLSAKLHKKVELKINGGGTELDKTVLEKIGDPMVHLVRNSMDHGIEIPEVRRVAGKPETGTLQLNAYHQGGNIVVEVTDDGAGLNTERILAKARERGLIPQDASLSDQQINNLIFQPGFSTVDVVSDVSGRGVGMDVVRRNIQDLGGSVIVESVRGRGSIFTIRLPLTLAILDGQLVRVGNEIYIISLSSIVESLQVSGGRVNVIAGKSELYQLRNDFIPLVRLHQAFNVQPDSTELEKGLLVVVESDGGRVGLFVDELLGQQQVVIKSLETNFRQIDSLSGATILGDGTVALILDIPGLVTRELAGRRSDTPRLRVA